MLCLQNIILVGILPGFWITVTFCRNHEKPFTCQICHAPHRWHTSWNPVARLASDSYSFQLPYHLTCAGQQFRPTSLNISNTLQCVGIGLVENMKAKLNRLCRHFMRLLTSWSHNSRIFDKHFNTRRRAFQTCTMHMVVYMTSTNLVL